MNMGYKFLKASELKKEIKKLSKMRKSLKKLEKTDTQYKQFIAYIEYRKEYLLDNSSSTVPADIIDNLACL